MKIISNPRSGIFNPRLIFAIALCLMGTLLAMVSVATTPPNGTLSPANRELTFTGGPFVIPTNSSDNAPTYSQRRS